MTERECPKCNKKIRWLYHTQRIVKAWRYECNAEGYDDYYDAHETGDLPENTQYACPKCWAVLFTDEWDAREFFKRKVKT